MVWRYRTGKIEDLLVDLGKDVRFLAEQEERMKNELDHGTFGKNGFHEYEYPKALAFFIYKNSARVLDWIGYSRPEVASKIETYNEWLIGKFEQEKRDSGNELVIILDTLRFPTFQYECGSVREPTFNFAAGWLKVNLATGERKKLVIGED